MVKFCNWKLHLGWVFGRLLLHRGGNSLRKQTQFAAPPLVPAPNDVETSAEILYWWLVTTQIWVVLLIGRAVEKITSANHMYLPDLGSDVSSAWNFCACFWGPFRGESSGNVAKCRLFSPARMPINETWKSKTKNHQKLLWLWLPDWIKFVWYLLLSSASFVWW